MEIRFLMMKFRDFFFVEILVYAEQIIGVLMMEWSVLWLW